MKTILPKRIHTKEQAISFLTELHKNGEHYHPEDNAHMICWNLATKERPYENPTRYERDQLNQLMEDIYNLDGNKGMGVNIAFDPCELLNNLDGHIMETE